MIISRVQYKGAGKHCRYIIIIIIIVVYTLTHICTRRVPDVYDNIYIILCDIPIYISKYTVAAATSFDSCAIIIPFYKLTGTLRATRRVSLKYLPELSTPPPPLLIVASISRTKPPPLTRSTYATSSGWARARCRALAVHIIIIYYTYPQ